MALVEVVVLGPDLVEVFLFKQLHGWVRNGSPGVDNFLSCEFHLLFWEDSLSIWKSIRTLTTHAVTLQQILKILLVLIFGVFDGCNGNLAQTTGWIVWELELLLLKFLLGILLFVEFHDFIDVLEAFVEWFAGLVGAVVLLIQLNKRLWLINTIPEMIFSKPVWIVGWWEWLSAIMLPVFNPSITSPIVKYTLVIFNFLLGKRFCWLNGLVDAVHEMVFCVPLWIVGWCEWLSAEVFSVLCPPVTSPIAKSSIVVLRRLLSE